MKGALSIVSLPSARPSVTFMTNVTDGWTDGRDDTLAMLTIHA